MGCEQNRRREACRSGAGGLSRSHIRTGTGARPSHIRAGTGAEGGGHARCVARRDERVVERRQADLRAHRALVRFVRAFAAKELRAQQRVRRTLSGRRPGPGADVAAVRGRGEPSPSAGVARASPGPGADEGGATPFPEMRSAEAQRDRTASPAETPCSYGPAGGSPDGCPSPRSPRTRASRTARSTRPGRRGPSGATNAGAGRAARDAARGTRLAPNRPASARPGPSPHKRGMTRHWPERQRATRRGHGEERLLFLTAGTAATVRHTPGADRVG